MWFIIDQNTQKEKKMEKKQYEKIKGTVLNGYTLDRIASWAIWDSKNLYNTQFIDDEKTIERLNPNIVFVALNFAGIDDDHKNDPSWKSWQNFHSDRRMDKRIYDVFSSTIYEGAYMTDIIKYSATPDAEALMEKIKAGEIDMELQLKMFIEEIKALGSDSIDLYLMGNNPYDIYTKYFMNRSEFSSVKRKIKSYKNIGSASPANTGWSNNLETILDLKKV